MLTSRRHPFRRAWSGLLAATLVLGTAALTLSGPTAQADTAPTAGQPATVSADPLPTVQIDGVAWDQVTVGNTVYVTGSFAYARPAGTAASSSSRVARANLLAYDITTGNLITSFNHKLNAVGRTLAVSPDRTRLYVGGGFTTVDGATHTRLAAFDLTTGALVPGFTASANGTVFALAATNTGLYVGGSFSTAGGVTRPRLAAFSSAGALTSWNPGANATVSSMVLAPDQSRVIVGGGFDNMAGQPRGGIGSVLTDGTAGPWPADFPIRDIGSSSDLTSLTTDGTLVYGTGYYYTSGGNFEGRFAADPTTGALKWMNSCHGDSYDLAVIGTVVYSAGHQHDCSDMGSYSQDKLGATSATHHYLAAETAYATGSLRRPIFTGGPTQPGNPPYFDFSGQPSGTQLQWFPVLAAGTYTGQSQAAWSVSGNASYLSVGGEFPTANGQAQQGLVRYAVRSLAPNKLGPTTPPAPTVVSLASGRLRVSWQASSDQDNSDLTYALYRDGGTTPVFTTPFSGSFWKRPSLGYTDTGLAVGSSHTYRVRVTDPLGNTVLGAVSGAATVSSTSTPSYPALVQGDGAAELWRFAEPSGSTAYSTAGYTDLTLRPAVSFGAPGPVPGNGTAATFTGATTSSTTSDSVAGATTDAQPRSTYTLEAWVKTTGALGGTVLSDGLYSPTNGQQSPTVDRVLYLENSGQARFGTFSHNANTTLGSPGAVNDGQWHHLAATMGTDGATLYVDGTAVAHDASMVDEAVFWGRWRVGGDALYDWTPQPTSTYFSGAIADVAVYPTALSADRIQAHAAAAGGVVGNVAPTAAFTASCTDLSCSFDGSGSTDSDGTITSYAWDFGDDGHGTGATPNHDYATAGAKTVTLTVTDDGGLTSSVSHVVTPTAPAGGNTPPTAAFTSSCTGLTCAFDGSGSTDAEGPISYAWDFGDGGSATGATPSHPYATAGSYPVKLTVTDSDGATDSVTHTAAPTAPAGTTFAADAFGRTASSGWGSADTGGAWTVTPSSAFSVAGGVGKLSMTSAGSTSLAYLGATTRTSTDLTMTLSLDKVPNATAYLDVIGRRVANQQEYDGLVKITKAGAVQVGLRKLNGSATAVDLATAVTTPSTYTAGSKLNVRMQVSGTGSTALKIKVWPAGGTEPSAWTATATDSSSALQAAGSVGLRGYLSSSATNAPVVVSVDNLAATPVA